MDLFSEYPAACDNDNESCRSDVPSVEEYLAMTEEEKDQAIQDAIIRLQTRVQEILYLLSSTTEKRKSP